MKSGFNFKSRKMSKAQLNAALLEAAENGDVSGVKDMLKRGAELNDRDSTGKTVLHYLVAGKGDAGVISTLIECGADIHTPDSDGKTALHWAAAFDKAEIMELLLANDAPINAQDITGQTPLHSAAAWANDNAAELLVMNGADTTIRDVLGLTPMHAATRKGHQQTALKIREAISHRQSTPLKAHALRKRKRRPGAKPG